MSNNAGRRSRARLVKTTQFKVDKSDNGNEVLCMSCSNASMRSGTLTQLQIYCQSEDFTSEYASGPKPIPFPVTQCDGFHRLDPSQPSRQELKALQKTAYYLVMSDEGKGQTFIPPDVAKRHELYDD